ncbi:hypothetical protein FG386_002542, partial [Cryptosporidium ryanae]|uniref:uncharacterized protein n=1 Tax=Cryptosporidium ryanae TaxID=515981 RepID=UPI00351A3A6D
INEIPLVNKRIFDPIKIFFCFGELYDSLLETVNLCESEACLNIKIEFLRKLSFPNSEVIFKKVN